MGRRLGNTEVVENLEQNKQAADFAVAQIAKSKE